MAYFSFQSYLNVALTVELCIVLIKMVSKGRGNQPEVMAYFPIQNYPNAALTSSSAFSDICICVYVKGLRSLCIFKYFLNQHLNLFFVFGPF